MSAYFISDVSISKTAGAPFAMASALLPTAFARRYLSKSIFLMPVLLVVLFS